MSARPEIAVKMENVRTQLVALDVTVMQGIWKIKSAFALVSNRLEAVGP